jgi:hypothetical protein
MQIVADMAPNQQGNERANLGLGAQGRHPLKVFVHRRRVQQFVKPFVAPPSHVLQAPLILAGSWREWGRYKGSTSTMWASRSTGV